jgi:hypothetical protein
LQANSSFSSLYWSKQFVFLLEFVDLLGVMFTGERRRVVVREREGVWLVKNEWRRRGWLVVGDGVLR